MSGLAMEDVFLAKDGASASASDSTANVSMHSLLNCTIECVTDSDEEVSVISRLSVEEDDEVRMRCLTCATFKKGGWMYCLECYRAHYRVTTSEFVRGNGG